MLIRPDRQHRATCHSHEILRNASHQDMRKAGSSVRRGDEQIDPVFASVFQNLNDWFSFEHGPNAGYGRPLGKLGKRLFSSRARLLNLTWQRQAKLKGWCQRRVHFQDVNQMQFGLVARGQFLPIANGRLAEFTEIRRYQNLLELNHRLNSIGLAVVGGDTLFCTHDRSN